ncbi:hypothetical protein Hanom_Chr05g00390171 [Helianthus anomalus]
MLLFSGSPKRIRPLACAWVNVSQDPIIGGAKKGMQLWERVTTRFHQFLDQEVYRTVDRCSLNFKVPMISWPSGQWVGSFASLKGPEFKSRLGRF